MNDNIRIIDACWLLDALERDLGHTEEASRLKKLIYEAPVPEIRNLIPQGLWVRTDSPAVQYRCSVCYRTHSSLDDYCPKCGAYMAGQEYKQVFPR